jgi:peptidoglycan-N-acetylmuramic acid deacetylase
MRRKKIFCLLATAALLAAGCAKSEDPISIPSGTENNNTKPSANTGIEIVDDGTAEAPSVQIVTLPPLDQNTVAPDPETLPPVTETPQQADPQPQPEDPTQPVSPTVPVNPPQPFDGEAFLASLDYNTVLPIPADATATTATENQIYTYGGIYRKNTGKNVIYITFTQGYENGNTLPMLDLLDSKNVKAAFFLVVKGYVNKEANIPIMQQIVSRGHIVGSHGYNHVYTNTLSDTDLINDIALSKAYISAALGGYNVAFYKAPYGDLCVRDVYVSSKLGMVATANSFQYYDYNAEEMPTKEAALEKLKKGMSPGAVYYLHVSQCNLEALGDFIDYARANGYEFLRLDQE